LTVEVDLLVVVVAVEVGSGEETRACGFCGKLARVPDRREARRKEVRRASW
jgi:hypothetical protein